jgi:hypothetical protein
VEQLDAGTQIDAEGLRVGGTLGGVLHIEQRLADAPHGDLYRGRFESTQVLVTFIDPILAAQPDVRSWLLRNIARAATVEHRNLLTQHGTFIHGRRCFVVQANPDGQTARQLLQDRAARGKTVDRDAAQTIVGHVCNALSALHQVTVHGNVTVDTVWISQSGRVLLSDPGVGALLSRMRRFERLRHSGRLPNVAPEQMLAPPPMSPGTDVFGIATLLLELVTGRPLPEAGVPVRALGLFGPDDLVMCLERATAPDAGARPPDVATFKSELAEALGGKEPLDIRAPDGAAAVVPRSSQLLADPRLHSGLLPLAPQPASGAVPSQMTGAMPPPPPGAPGQGVPMMGMPGMPVMGMPAPQMMPMMPAGSVPPGFSVIGVPMAGPGGVPTMVPMLVGMAGMGVAQPAAAPASASSTARARAAQAQGSDAMRELDRATRRIADSAPKDAVLELTEDVSSSSTRLAAEASEMTTMAAASASSLRLDVRTMEEAADRLETLDAGIPEPQRNDPTPLPSGDDAFFPSFATPDGDNEAGPARVRRGAIALDSDDIEAAPRGYIIAGTTEERSLAVLIAMIRTGALGATDGLVHPLTQRRLAVIDVPELRAELAAASLVPPARPIPTAQPIMQRPMMVQPSTSFGSTMLWIAAAVVVFVGAGVFLWWRQTGG